MQRQPTAFDFGHVHDIVDQAEQMLAGGCNFAQAVLYLLRVFQVGVRNRRHADNPVHRGADIVAHIGKEFAFCLVCAHRACTRVLQRAQLPACKSEVNGKHQQQRRQDNRAAYD